MKISKEPANYRYQPPAARTRRAALVIESTVTILVIASCALVLFSDDGIADWLAVPMLAFLAYRVIRLAAVFRRAWRDAASLDTNATAE